MKIRWENKYSKETGYVKKLNHKDGYFENTCSEEEAMEISDRQDIAEKTIALLEKWSGQNIYTLVPTEKKPEKQKISEEEETAELIIEVEKEDDIAPETAVKEKNIPVPEEKKKDCIPSGEKPKEKKSKEKAV